MPTDKNLQEMARHVAYGRTQMLRARQAALLHLQEYADAWSGGEEHFKAWVRTDLLMWEAKRNALLESVLVHYRSLLEFLAPPLSRMSDETITARMFRDVPAPVHYKKRINTLLSHMSKKRADTTKEERIWDELEEMLDEIEEAWQGFLRALEANYPERVAWFSIYDVEEKLEAGVEHHGSLSPRSH